MSARRPTLAQVAARAGVSTSTASLAFGASGPVSDRTRERVLQAAADLDYAGPDPRGRSLRQGRSDILAVAVDGTVRQAFRDPVMVAFLDGIADEVAQQGLSLLLVPGVGAGTAALGTVPVDAVVLVGCGTSVQRTVAVAQRRGLPVVLLSSSPAPGVPGVDLDDRAESAALTRHLADLGHRAVGVVLLPLDDSGRRGVLTDRWLADGRVSVAQDRFAGVRDVLTPVAAVVGAGSLVEEGWAAGRALLGEPVGDGRYRPRPDRPTAVVAQSDLLAAGVIQAAEDMGLQVPGDLSVVGFDGIRIDTVVPHDLTTMVQPATEQGRAAGRMALDLLGGGGTTVGGTTGGGTGGDGTAGDAAGPVVHFRSVFHRGATTAPPRARDR